MPVIQPEVGFRNYLASHSLVTASRLSLRITLACHAITEAEIVAERYLPSPPNRNCATTTAIMASVTSLDSDMRKLRLDRYTPQAANEVRSFIEESLGERLDGGDLLASLKDGVALCKYEFSCLF
jgi:hypothetical protein